MSVLERIHSPADVKLLDKADTAKLAAEMRHVIIQTVARNAGHLAPNLGVVELTLADRSRAPAAFAAGARVSPG
ncbi:MAG TPA: 1-deoxy-D-xylulose-5-phosphate synthase N-terminal domain-containing protein, partial [Verrucomicrobiae bacterium]|nr:1-deoxy-D-xylulose-5-phosphate synthase N-terminal domain-containing protein [Verrucomicrobiae bacterium]